MAKMSDLRDGLTILLKYDLGIGDTGPARAGGFVDCQHGVLYAGVSGRDGHISNPSEADIDTLNRLGWFWSVRDASWKFRT